MPGNTIGTLFTLTSFGESHGAAIGGVVDGCPPAEFVCAEELLESASSVAVQQASTMQETLPIHVFFLSKVANQVYTQWIKGLSRT